MELLVTDKPRGAPQVDDRRVLNGIFRVLRSGAPGVTCRNAMARARPATIASLGGAMPVLVIG
jgi:transposase